MLRDHGTKISGWSRIATRANHLPTAWEDVHATSWKQTPRSIRG